MATSQVAKRRVATREAIPEAAWDLAHESGLEQIGMWELAAKLGMAASSLYEYFDGKDAIYDAMFIQGNEALRDEYRYLESMEGLSARQTSIEAARRFIEFCDADPAASSCCSSTRYRAGNPPPKHM